MIILIGFLIILILLNCLLCRIDKIWYFLKHGDKEINKKFRNYIK